MPNHQKVLHGDALKLAERFWETGTLGDLKRFRSRYRDFGSLLIAGVSEDRRATLGLILQRGQPVLLSEQTHSSVVTSANLKSTGPPVSVNQKSKLRVHDYGPGFDVESARAKWSEAASPADRIGIIRSTPSILRGEVDCAVHGGAFDGNKGVTFIGAYAGSLLSHLTAPAMPNSEAQLLATQYQDDVVYGVCPDPNAEGSLVIVRDERFATVDESGATFSYDGARSDRALPRRRSFTLSGTSFFDVDPDLLGQIVEGEVKPNETLPLYGDAANVVGDYVREQDSSVLRPIATRFTVAQYVVPPFAEILT